MTVRTERIGRTMVVTIDRPEARNALDARTGDELRAAWLAFADDDDLWTAVLTGAGDVAFCAGADLKRMDHAAKSTDTSAVPSFGYLTGRDVGKPVIAAINGWAVGGGLELALACDLRIASGAARLGLPEVRWGLIPGAGGTYRLPQLIPRGIAMQMMLTGKPISAERAHELGLVNVVTTPEELMPTALAMAEQITANGPLAVRAVRDLVRENASVDHSEALAMELRASRRLHRTDDAHEGTAAFAERRVPEFRGR